MEPLTGILAAKAVGGMWFVRELFSFFLKLRRSDRTYAPDREWKTYVMTKFDSLQKDLHELKTAQKVLRAEFNYLEKLMGGNRNEKVRESDF